MDTLRNSSDKNRDMEPSHILIPTEHNLHLGSAYEIVSHCNTLKVSFPDKVDILLSESQQDGAYAIGDDLYKTLHNDQSLNINALEDLLQNQSLIPEFWKKDWKDELRVILFWGTVFKAPSGNLCIKGLYWDNHKWCVDDFAIEGYFSNCFAAAVATA